MAQLVVTRAAFARRIAETGLNDAQVFEAVRFKDVQDLIKALFPDMGTKLDSEAQILACSARLRCELRWPAAWRTMPSPAD